MTVDFWMGAFGDEYTARNRVDWRSRMPFWRRMLDRTGARSVFEVGCNAGWNLSAIRRISPDVEITGCEINETAFLQALNAGLSVSNESGIDALAEYENCFDLVFTAGVLIHVPEIRGVMQAIVAASCDYVLAVEYASESGDVEPIPYRGHEDKLWRRDYGSLYENLGLKIIEIGDAEGFDRCTYWLCKK